VTQAVIKPRGGPPKRRKEYAPWKNMLVSSPRAKSLWNLPLAGQPLKKLVRFRYAEEISLNPGNLGPTVAVFSANGMYDPNVSGAGHQPMGFDQNMAFYDHFRVIMSKIYVKYVSKDGINSIPGYLDVFLTDNGTTIAPLNTLDFLESRFSNGKAYTAGTERNFIGQPAGVTKYFNSDKFFGRKDTADLQGSTTANPVEGAFFEVGFAPIGGNNPIDTQFVVIIEYIAELTEPKSIARS